MPDLTFLQCCVYISVKKKFYADSPYIKEMFRIKEKS
jgi:hypothetical protein